MRKISALILAILLCLALPVTALASSFHNGDGSSLDPFIIMTPTHLSNVRNYLNPALYFRLGNDIDLTDFLAPSGAGWEPVGCVIDPFIGNFNGNRYVISGLWINRLSSDEVGLFGRLGSGGVIRNLGVEIADAGVTGGGAVGGLVGRLEATGSIENSYVTGIVSGNGNVGGLVGWTGGDILNSYATGIVNGNTNVGGLVGWQNSLNITNSFSTGIVIGNTGVGGLVGARQATLFLPAITNSFATGNITAVNASTAGGLVGSQAGMFVPFITNSFHYENVTINDNPITIPDIRHGNVLTADQLISRVTYGTTGPLPRLNWIFDPLGPWHWDSRGFPKLNIGTEDWPFPFLATVTFDSQGGSQISYMQVQPGSTVTRPPNPTKAGYVFAGWYREAGVTNLWNFNTDTVTWNMTLYARWSPGTPLTITPPNLPEVVAGVGFSYTFSAGGITPVTWSYEGDLPPGLTLNTTTGVISGVPTTPGTFDFTIIATYAAGAYYTRDITIVVVATATVIPPTITTNANLLPGTVGVTYNATLSATGTPPLTWTVVAGTGALPTGLTLSPAGVISGIPTVAGTFTFTVRVTNVASPITGDTRAFTIVVSRVPGVPGGDDDRPIGPGHGGSSSGGCNVASGLLAMILILPLFFVKKKK